MVTIKSGSLDDFFDSAIESAREIDKGIKVKPKQTIWMETDDMLKILKPQRAKLVNYLRNKSKVYYSNLIKNFKKSPTSLNKDLELLYKYHLIDIVKESNSGHGIKKVIIPLFKNEKIELRAII